MVRNRHSMSLSESLREAIRRSGLNPNQLQNATGVLSDSVARFLRDEQSLRLDAADKLAAFLGVYPVVPSGKEARRNVLKANDYINVIVDEWNSLCGEDLPHTGGHFVTL